MSFGYRIENEDTGGPEFDYLGHYARARLRTPIFESELQPKLTLAYEYFEKDYRNITAASGVKRKDSRQTASAELSVRIAERWTGSASYELGFPMLEPIHAGKRAKIVPDWQAACC